MPPSHHLPAPRHYSRKQAGPPRKAIGGSPKQEGGLGRSDWYGGRGEGVKEVWASIGTSRDDLARHLYACT